MCIRDRVYQELKRVEVYTKRIEDATARTVQIDGKSLESAENRLKKVLADFERQGYRDVYKRQGFDFTKFKEELGKRGFKVREARASTGKLNGYYVTARSGTESKLSLIHI